MGLAAGVAVLAVVVGVVLSSVLGAAHEVLLQPAASTGPDPFTPSAGQAAAATPSPAATTPSPTANGLRALSGSTAGLYGGSMNNSSCDVPRLVRYLTADRDKERAWAAVEGIQAAAVPSYIRSLTPVLLRADTRVTNHGYRNGAATSFQSVLQAGTAVLVDDHGLPRVRCACGNPLTPPVLADNPRYTGQSWPSYQPSNLVVVTAAPRPMTAITVIDIQNGSWFERFTGDSGSRDQPVPPPTNQPSGSATPSPSASSVSSPAPSASTAPSVSSPPSTPPSTAPTSGPPTPTAPATSPPAAPPS
ncbi:DUF6777 domain-containing protein [Streptantibioticus rubrisoli]|uniref:DUF6777 domain-containing protein n=1 Tax=Streptantibioticus rubrisoli TaxID=1387313 RepID=A0ABT1PCQ7_9ACTN|nr:DUF6777 domain-containing protein [Streptantibioticus rubrisoli]MCQ4043149.1 hypothetical protein [Streptantibioticus rubrisoli]